jgi:hypothetical protein
MYSYTKNSKIFQILNVPCRLDCPVGATLKFIFDTESDGLDAGLRIQYIILQTHRSRVFATSGCGLSNPQPCIYVGLTQKS